MACTSGEGLVILHTVWPLSFYCQAVFQMPGKASATVRWVFSSAKRKGSRGSMFKTVERNLSLTDRTERQIRQLIADQSLRSGERLPPQDELAERLGVSRTVVREAMRFLMAKGLLEARKGSGVYVRHAKSDPPVQSGGDDVPASGKLKTESSTNRPRTGTGHLLPEERRRRIVEMLHHAERITVSDLVDR